MPIISDYAIGVACSLTSAATWALGVIIYKRLGESLSPFALNLLKNVLVALMMVPAIAISGEGWWPQMTSVQWQLALLSGAIGISLADTLYFRALNDLGAGRIGIIGNLFSPFVIALAVLFLHERMNSWQMLGFVIVMGGVGLVNSGTAANAGGSGHMLRGVLIGVLAVFLNAVGIVMVKPVLSSDAPFFWVALIRMLGAITIMLIIWPFRRADFRLPTWRKIPWPLLLLAAFCGQFVSMLLWLAGYKFIPATLASVLNETASIFILLFAAIWLKEKLTPRKLLGVLCTVGGVAILLFAKSA
jgi:drug/metabolite transporter (DMT)-like permease